MRRTPGRRAAARLCRSAALSDRRSASATLPLRSRETPRNRAQSDKTRRGNGTWVGPSPVRRSRAAQSRARATLTQEKRCPARRSPRKYGGAWRPSPGFPELVSPHGAPRLHHAVPLRSRETPRTPAQSDKTRRGNGTKHRPSLVPRSRPAPRPAQQSRNAAKPRTKRQNATGERERRWDARRAARAGRARERQRRAGRAAKRQRRAARRRAEAPTAPSCHAGGDRPRSTHRSADATAARSGTR